MAGKWQWETAKGAIDYLKGHSGHTEKPHIRFYGGEPLLNFELIKRSIQYAIRKIFDKKLFFALTTNATLVTSEIESSLLIMKLISLSAWTARKNCMMRIEYLQMELGALRKLALELKSSGSSLYNSSEH